VNNVPKERLLIHGPCLQDLTDLLYFDKIVYPTTTAITRPRNLPPGYAGYPVEEPLPQAVRDKLVKAGLIVSPGEVLLVPVAGDIAAQLLQGAEAFTQWMQQSAIDMGKALGEIAFSFLDTPANRSEVIAWLRDIDAKTKKLTDLAVKRGQRAVAKYYLDDVTKTLKPGWSLVLSITFLRFPSIQVGHAGIDDLIAFLSHAETREKRQALFDWPLQVEAAVNKGQLSIEEIPYRIAQLLDDYSSWIRQSGLASRFGVGEFLFTFGASFIERLTKIEIDENMSQILALGPRGLSLTDADIANSGRELAYLSHSRRGYGE
jgi:hypothetical protein